MRKIFTVLLSALMLSGTALTASAAAPSWEKGVDYIVAEEAFDSCSAFGDAYPASLSEGWPACSTGELLKGTVITGEADGITCTEENYAYKAFDGDPNTFFEVFELSHRSFVGLILDEAYELTEVRIKPAPDRPTDRFHGLNIQGSNDGITWQTIIQFRQDATGKEYHIFTPQPVTDQGYIDAGYTGRHDNSPFWIAKDGSYSMYRVFNPATGLPIAISEIEFYGVAKEATDLDARELANRQPTLHYYPGNIVVRNAEVAEVDGNLKGTIIGGGWVWNRGLYELAFDNDPKKAYDSEYIGYDSWVGMMFDEPHALTEVKIMPKRGGYGHMENAEIQGSLDGVNWRTLAVVTKEVIPSKQEFVTKEITDTAGYTYFRYISGNTGLEAPSMGECEAADLLFYGAPAPAAEPFTVDPAPIADLYTYEGEIYDLGIQNEPLNDSLVGQAIRAGGRFLNRDNATWEFAFDGDLTTAYSKAETNTYGLECFVGLVMKEPTAATYVSLVPPENGFDKVAGVHIQGSEDGVNWKDLAVYDFADVPAEQVPVVKAVTDPTAYTFFRVISDQVRGLAVCEFGIYNGAAPEIAVPETAAPETAAPETAAPETAAPETAAPETDAPETAAPETAAPETAAPETDVPAEDEGNPNAGGIVIAIAAAAVLLGAGVAVIIAKRKK